MTPSRWLLLAYLALAVASRLWIALAPVDRPVIPADMQTVTLDAYEAGERRNAPVELAYRTIGPADAEAVLLLHGSPGSLQDFDDLARRIGAGHSVLVPDMAGFGHSGRDVPDYSFVAQADYLLQLIDRLGIERVHLVGFSWGGGVALELAARAPARVSSIVMVSAIGVQELELLGRFELNRLVHAFQHALVVAIDWAIPHFGLLGVRPLGIGFTRSFLDSDQRSLRPALEGWQGPMLILHGREDFLVPAAAAHEHHRIVPQSRILWIEGGHLVLWQHPQAVASALVQWLDESDRDGLPHRADADPERVARAAGAFDRSLAGPQNGLGWLVFFLLVFAASMVSEDLTCAGVGLLVATGQVGFIGGVAACVYALVAGDLLLYAGGRAIGPPLLRRLGRDPGEIGPIGERLRRSGGIVVLLGRFVPGARLPTYVAAGVISHPIAPMVFWLTLAALLWAPALVGLTALAGRAIEMQSASPETGLGIGIVLIVAIAIGARVVPRLFTYPGRRLLLARWRRLRRWEFWPIWALYAPMLPAIASLALQHRSLRAVTLVNPPIEGGGLAGESKAALAAVLDRVREHSIPTEVLEPSDVESRYQALSSFVEREGLHYPIVLKPDVGERGRGVLIASDADAARDYLDSHPDRCLAQAYVAGPEFGLFYARRPDRPTGELFSLARKQPRCVIGNGRDPLERLILEDPICLPMAHRLLALNRPALDRIPTAGERVQLTQLGTHSMGCRFLVGEDLRTSALEGAVDRLSRAADLDFGRYDVRAPDEAALREGRFQVIEFNGLTGEAAHMYDPRYGLADGLRILRDQWRRAFEIGALHRDRGRRPLSWRALWMLVRASRA